MKKALSFLSVGLLSVGLVACSDNTDDSSQPKNDPPQQSTQPVNNPTPTPTPTPAPEPPKNSPKISKAEFDQIQNGMSYEEIVKIIGGEGEIMSEAGEKGSPYYSVLYKYEGEGEFGANANFMFQGGKLLSKAQYGLK